MRLIDADKLRKEILEEKAWKADGILKPRYGQGQRDAYYDCVNVIDNQSQVNQWIPVSERLPEQDNTRSYLVTKMCRDEDRLIHEVCTEIFWIKDSKWDCERDELCEWKVIAWQPLPEPYKEEADAESNDNN